jgi:hypothetical protein
MIRPFVVIAMVLASAMSSHAQSVDTLYFLPKSVVTITGTVTTKNTFTASGLVKEAEPGAASVVAGIVADPTAHYFHRADTKLLSKHSYTLELSSGVVAGINSVSEGQAGVILKNVLGIVAGIAKLAAGAPFTAASPVEQAYAGDFPELAKRRTAIKTAIGSMLDAANNLEGQLVVNTDPGKRQEMRLRIDDYVRAISRFRVEAETLDAHFTAWKTRKEDAKEQQYEWIIDADDLLDHSAVEGKKLPEILKAARPHVAEVINRMRIVVSRQWTVPTSMPAVPQTGGYTDSVFYRVPLPTTFRIYRVMQDDSLELVRQTSAGLLSAASPIGTAPAPDSKWSKRTVAATFQNGALTKVSAESGSELAAATEAVRGLPAEYLSVLKQTNEISAEQRKLSLNGIDAQLEKLKKQKEKAELELAQEQLVGVGAAKNAIAELETQIKLLETQRAMGDAQNAAGDRNTIRLENELTKLQIEQAELRKKLEALIKELDK